MAKPSQGDSVGPSVSNEVPVSLPSVSLVLPVRNEEKYIRACLESLVQQDYPRVIEIVMVDGMSDDATRGIIAEWRVLDSKISLLDNPARIQTFALNKGIEAARGDVIVRIDAHAVYEVDYVSQCVRYLLQTGAGNVGGPMIPRTGASSLAQAIVLAHRSRFGIGVAKFHHSSYEGNVDTVWLGAFWKRVFEEVGPFTEELARSEDIDWNARLRQLGYKVLLTPKIRAQYFPRHTLRGLREQSFANGVGISQSLFVNWRAIRLRHLVPVLFLLAILGCVVAAFFTPFALAALAGILGSYLALCLLSSAQIAWKNGLKYLPIMPLVFWTIHFSYGLGSLWGLLKFGVIKRWGK